jgi:hypothetical protein
MHYGSSAYFFHVVLDFLDSNYHNRRIGKEIPNVWPHPRLPDFNSLDLSSSLLACAFSCSSQSRDTLHARMSD